MEDILAMVLVALLGSMSGMVAVKRERRTVAKGSHCLRCLRWRCFLGVIALNYSRLPIEARLFWTFNMHL